MSVNSAVLSRDRSNLRIPKITPAGEVWFFVDIAQVTNHSLEEVEAIARSLGYVPEIRIAEYFRGGESRLEPVMLLHQGSAPVSEALLQHWEDLASRLQPSTSVHLRSSSDLEK